MSSVNFHLPLLASVVLLVCFAALMWGVTLVLAHRQRAGATATSEHFLVAGRNVPRNLAAASIAAGWIWAPALFVGAQKAYQQGAIGVFWFVVPNVATLLIFAPFVAALVRRVPSGYTLPQYMRHRYGGGVQSLYLLQMLTLGVAGVAEQLVGGSAVLSGITGIPTVTVTLILTGIVLVYSLVRGLAASIITNYMHLLILLAVGVPLVIWAVVAGGGLPTIAAGLGGASGRFGPTAFFAPQGMAVLATFGLTASLGLLAGPFGDQSFWQQGYAVEPRRVRSAFIRSALIFSVVITALALLGFLAAGVQRLGLVPGFHVANPTTTNLAVVEALLPRGVLVAFVLMLLSGLTSAMDTSLSAVAALISVDVMGALVSAGRMPAPADLPRARLRVGRAAMIATAAIGVGIANIPGVTVLLLFLFYATIRTTTFLPTVITMLSVRPRRRAVLWGIAGSMVLGMPVYAYGTLTNSLPVTVAGVALVAGVSGVSTLASCVVTRRMRNRALPPEYAARLRKAITGRTEVSDERAG